MTDEFQEIGHCGGRIYFEQKDNSIQTTIVEDRPVPSVFIALYTLEPGVPVAEIHLGGVGQGWNPPPYPNCIPVFIGSDSEGYYGHHCPRCKAYWRSGPWPNLCPYCHAKARSYLFLSQAQRRYIERYCEVYLDALYAEDGEKFEINMDEIADAAGKDGEKPPFYVSDQSQQYKFNCTSCDEYNDVLGKFVYCSRCGTRNDLRIFEDEIVSEIRHTLRGGGRAENCLRDAVSAFDSFVSQYARQLAGLVPMTEERKNRLLKQTFHKLEEVRETFKSWFDIDVFAGMKKEESRSAAVMFYRRHIYEHNAHQVTQRYLDDSRDNTVRLGQTIRETDEGIHNFLGLLIKMARNLHRGFHELIPPLTKPIDDFERKRSSE
jgi:hypothetical protein